MSNETPTVSRLDAFFGTSADYSRESREIPDDYALSYEKHPIMQVARPTGNEGVHMLSPDERNATLKAMVPRESWPDIFSISWALYFREGSRRMCTFRVEEGSLKDRDLLRACRDKAGHSVIAKLMEVSLIADEKYLELCERLGIQEQWGIANLSFNSGRGFSASSLGGSSVGVGQEDIYDLAKVYLSEDEQLVDKITLAMETRYFHEKVHYLVFNGYIGEGTEEELTGLSDFLYATGRNPLIDRISDRETELALDEEGNRALGNWSDRYEGAWKYVVLPILLHELAARGKVIDSNLIRTLSKQYKEFTDEEREDIFLRYAPLSSDQLYELGQKYIKELEIYTSGN